MTTRDEELADHLVHGLQPVFVELAEYDPGWPAAYRRVADRLRGVLGERVLRIEHVGSTSVPGLAAKPVIDVALGLADPEDEDAFLPELTGDGWDLRVRQPGHRCLRGSIGDLGINLHCYPVGSTEIVRYLVFRDRLRAHPDDRRRYEELKRSLAGREWPDMNHYADAKGPLIEEIIARAGGPSR